MSRKPRTKQQVVKEYAAAFPASGNLTLAKHIYKENPNLFPTIEAARSAVRHVRGNHGKRSRDKALTELMKKNGKAGEYKIPKSLVPKNV